MAEGTHGIRQSVSAGEPWDEGLFTLDDFRKMLRQVKRMSTMQPMTAGMAAMQDLMKTPDAESEVRRLSGIIDSMTPDERRSPVGLIDQPRRFRIAAGAGVVPHEVNQFVEQFDGMAKLMTRMRQLRQLNWRNQS